MILKNFVNKNSIVIENKLKKQIKKTLHLISFSKLLNIEKLDILDFYVLSVTLISETYPTFEFYVFRFFYPYLFS